MLTQKIFAAAQNGAEAILVILLLLSIISVAIILERYWGLRTIRKDSQKIKKRLTDALQANHLEELEDISKERETLEGRALSYALRQINTGNSKSTSEIFNTFIFMERPPLEKYLNFLATVGSNAPFIGLLGTVLGIMKAFNDLGLSPGNASALMVGIAEALVATAVGLFVAIPAVVAYNYFQKQVKQVIQNLEGLREMCIAYAKSKGSI